jgi:hypothetical protein
MEITAFFVYGSRQAHYSGHKAPPSAIGFHYRNLEVGPPGAGPYSRGGQPDTRNFQLQSSDFALHRWDCGVAG